MKDAVEGMAVEFVELDIATLLSGIALMAGSIGLAFVAIQLASLGLVYTGLATISMAFAESLVSGAMAAVLVTEVTLLVKTFAGYPLNSVDAVSSTLSKFVMIASNV